MREGGRPDGKLAQRGAMIFMLNAQRYFEDREGVSPGQVIQGIWNLRDPFKSNRRTLVLLGPAFVFPPELAQDVIEFDEPYPNEGELRAVVTKGVAEAGLAELDDAQVEQAIDAVTGLAAFTAEQVIAMSLTKAGLDVDALWQRKVSVVEQTKGLSVDRGDESFDDVCEVDNFLSFARRLVGSAKAPTLYVRLDEMEKSFGGLGVNGGPADNTGMTQDLVGVILRTMEDYNWTGFIMVGHAGTGKSLVTKSLANAASKIMKRRVLSTALDLGALMTSAAGETGQAMRVAVKVIRSLARGGRVCVVGTCNDMNVLPPALKRRFKLGTWMFDLPGRAGKDKMWAKNAKKYGVKEKQFPDDADWTGSDIRNVCETAELLGAPLSEVIGYTTFVAKSDPEAIARLQRIADGKFVSASSPGVYRAPGLEGRRCGSRRAGPRLARRGELI